MKKKKAKILKRISNNEYLGNYYPGEEVMVEVRFKVYKSTVDSKGNKEVLVDFMGEEEVALIEEPLQNTKDNRRTKSSGEDYSWFTECNV